MIEKTLNSLIQSIVDEFSKYGVRMQAKYNPDLDSFTEYTKSLNFRSMFIEKQLDLLDQSQLEDLKKESYVLLLYNYKPFARSRVGRMNNMNMQLVFNPNSPESLDEFGKLSQVAKDELNLFFRMVRDGNALPTWTPALDGSNNVLPSSYPEDRNEKIFVIKGITGTINTPMGEATNDDRAFFNSEGELSAIVPAEAPPPPLPGKCRDMVMGEIEVDIKILTSSTSLINDMQFIHVAHLQDNRPLEINLDFGEGVGEHTFEYSTVHSEIQDVGHVDYANYGNLQHLTFTVLISGPFFSFYSQDENYIDYVDVQVKFFSGPIEVPDEVVFPPGT